MFKKQKSKIMRKLKKGLKQKLVQANEDVLLHTEYPLEALAKDKSAMNSPRQKRIEHLRRIKIIEAKSRERDLKEESERQKKLDQLLKTGLLGSQETEMDSEFTNRVSTASVGRIRP